MADVWLRGLWRPWGSRFVQRTNVVGAFSPALAAAGQKDCHDTGAVGKLNEFVRAQ